MSNYAQTIDDEHQRWLSGFFAGAWALSLRGSTISREAYIATLSDLHYYVKDTTRLIGAAVMSPGSRELRRHWARHLTGEVNHETLLERDLEALGAPIDEQLRDPSTATVLFAALQQATFAGLDPDPVLALACPLAAEGVSAHMSAAHIDGLHSAITSWGCDAKACSSFLTSHIHTDGADGQGHHRGVIDAIRRHVHTDAQARKFGQVQRAAQSSFRAAFDGHLVTTWA